MTATFKFPVSDTRGSLPRPLADAVPGLAGARAFRMFCTPALSSHRAENHEQLVERARFHLRGAARHRITTSVGEIQAYVFEPEAQCTGSVLVVHGWTGEAAFMTAMSEHFRRRGLRVVLIDLPAHGLSSGSRTSLMNCAHAVREAAGALGPIRFAVGHSIGGLAVLLAGEGRKPLPRAYPFEAYALISMPDRFADVTRRFGDEKGLSSSALRAFEHRLEHLAHRRIVDFTGTNLLAGTMQPTLLLHSRDDEEVPFVNAEAMAARAKHAELQAFDGFGHRMVLYAPPVVRAAGAFLVKHS